MTTCLLTACLAMGHAAEAGPDTAALRAVAEQRMAAKDVSGAWLAVTDWVAQAPADPAARLALARVAADLNAPALVIANARRGLNANPDAAQAQALLLLKAQAHLQVGEAPAAWTAFSHLLELDGGNPELRALADRARWQAYAQLGGRTIWQRFLAHAEAEAAAPQASASAVLRLVRWLAQAGQQERALVELRSALGRWPQDAQVRDALADLLLSMEPVEQEFAEGERLTFRLAHAADRALVAAGNGGLASASLIGRWPLMTYQAASKHDPLTPESVRQRLAELHTARTALPTALATALPALHAGAEAGAALSPADAAAYAAWQARMSTALRTLEQAMSALRSAEESALDLNRRVSRELAAARGQTPPATAQALQAAQALFTAESGPLDGESPVSAAVADFETATVELITVKRAHDAAVSLQALQTLAQGNQPQAVLAASEELFSWGIASPAVWRLRFAAAEQVHDAHEMLISGARAFTGEWLVDDAALDRPLPEATAALQARLTALAADADHALGEATAAWQAGDAVHAFTALDQALAIDPANARAWHDRWQWSEASKQSAAALAALRTWWQLDDVADADLPLALSTAARGGNWDLLLSVAEQRLILDPLDAEAHLMRATAALATDRDELIKAETPLLAATQAYASGALITALHAGTNADAALPPRILQTIGTPLEIPGLRLWRDYLAERAKPGTAAAEPAIDLSKDPAGIHHERLAGRLTPEDYRERAHGTPEEALAGWVEATLTRRAGASAEATRLLSAAAANDRLPLPFRAEAGEWLLSDSERKPVAALRAGDPWNGKPSDYGDGTLPIAAGQEVVLTGIVQLERWQAGTPVCVRGIGGYPNLDLHAESEAEAEPAAAPEPAADPVATAGPAATADPAATPARADGQAAHPPRLFVARDAIISGSWTSGTPIIADLMGCEFTIRTPVTYSGTARLIDCNASDMALTLPAGSYAEWRQVRGTVDAATISGTWRCRSDDFALLAAPAITAQGVWNVADSALAGRVVPTVAAGGQVAWDGVRGDATMTWPAELPAGMLLTGCTVTAPVATPTAAVLPIPAPHRDSCVLALPTADATVRHAATVDELKAALEAAKPGEICELAPGSYASYGPLVIPPGVVLRGTDCSLSTHSVWYLHAAGAGARVVRGISIIAQGDEPKQVAASVTDGAWLALDDTWLGGLRDKHGFGYVVAADCRLRLHGSAWTDGAPQIDPRATVDPFTTVPSAATRLRTAIADHTRDQLWALATADFPRMWAGGDHRAAARALAASMHLAAEAAGLSRVDFTIGLYGVLQPVLRKVPSEAPPVLLAADEDCDQATEQRLLDPLFQPYFATYVKGIHEEVARKEGVSFDSVYTFLLAFPVGSADHDAAMNALGRGLSVAQARQEIADNARKAAERAEQLRKAAAERPVVVEAPVEEEWTPRPAHSGYESGSAWGSSAASWGSSGGPSEAQRMSNYGAKLDDRLDRIVRGY